MARPAGALFRRIGQPPVIGEVVAGIALGPSLLGGWSDVLFTVDTSPLLDIVRPDPWLGERSHPTG